MNSYGVDLSYVLPDNAKMKVAIVQHNKGPVKSKYVTYMKDNAGRLCAIMNKPQTLDLGGHKINKVMNYVVSNFVDAATDKGKLYDIETLSSDISAYTYDGKFAFLREQFNRPRTIKIGNHILKDAQFKTETADIDTEIENKVEEMVQEFSGEDYVPVSFVSEKNTNVEAVQFAFQTDPIQIEEEEAREESPAENTGFWEKIRGLFE